ncbi:PAS domain-containing hybrid sensor histidine kinase/response regulator [Microvirga massiliensis]|uniref:PAS domain-containing hybrid sensor histidine kinase/response regulator n=1 Tax=Microvirga massiliensis TaxID=1033741 RepID=UPI001FCDDA85|nr:PAS domain-containing hybrid sensor histidine kinase/response regulator [Microvirga massiliensis]
MVGLNLDVTTRKEAEEALRASEERFAFALDASEDSLWDWDIRTNALWISDHCCALLGFERHEIEPHLRSWEDRIHPEDKPKVQQALRDHVAGLASAIEIEHRLQHKDGSRVWALDRGKVVVRDDQGRPVRAVGTLIDITHRKNAECALVEAKAAADQARTQTEQASAAKSEFLATVSHEARTPLHGILGHTDLLLRDTSLTENQRRHAERIHRACSALLTVVNGIFDFSRIDACQIELDPQQFALAALLDNTISIVKGMADAKGLALRVEAADDLPKWVVGDQDRLRQVLLNLLNNAVKFTPMGSVTLRVLAIDADGLWFTLSFSVEDTGIGIPHDKHDHLFERFSQREFGGTGLGLAISKHLVDLMGGEIGLQSKVGFGTAFWFNLSLPIARGEARSELTQTSTCASLMTSRILLAEDNEINQEIARALLETSGHEVDVVSDGAQAIMAVQVKAYDLVLMDIQMPNVDGIAAAQRIRALDYPARSVPIVAMTANVLPQQVQRFHAAA